MVGTKFQNENIILLFYITISLFHWALSLVAFHVLFISSLGTVVLKILILFQFFCRGEESGKTFLNNENAADKEDLYSCVAVFCSSASSLIHFSLGIWSQAGSEEENWQIAQ